MSWRPSQDPSSAIEILRCARTRHRAARAQTSATALRCSARAARTTKGAGWSCPFIFFDQMGPVQFVERPRRRRAALRHPHIGLATVTYLFDGRVMHRDSEGNALEILPAL